MACLAGTAAAQPFPNIPGYNVGLNPRANVTAVMYLGQPALLISLLGPESIASFYNPIFMPPGTKVVEFDVVRWGVFESNACAVGAGLFFDTNSPLSTTPVATVPRTGWSAFAVPWTFRYAAGDPFVATWFLNYCSVFQCTSPCGPGDRDPDWEGYLLRVRIQ